MDPRLLRIEWHRWRDGERFPGAESAPPFMERRDRYSCEKTGDERAATAVRKLEVDGDFPVQPFGHKVSAESLEEQMRRGGDSRRIPDRVTPEGAARNRDRG